jgi:branched-chain amino acid transport system substrate-binding protein
MTRRPLWLGATVAIAALTAMTTSASAATSQRSADPIVIGLVANQTGFMQAYDDPPSQGVELAVRDINAAGGVLGRQLKVVKFDEKTKPELGSTGALDVISKGASAVITSCDFDFGSPAALAAQTKKVPGLSTCAGDPKFGAQGIGQYAYTMAQTTNYEGGAIAQWAYQTMKWRTAYVITDTTIEYTKGIARFTSDAFKHLGGKVVGTDTMSNADQSISAQITRLKGVKPAPDFVVLSSFNPGLAAAVKQVRAAGIKLPLIGGSGWDGTYWLKGIPKLSNAYHGALGFTNGPGVAKNWAVSQKYKKAYGKTPINAYFLTGYVAVQAIAQAIKTSKSTEGEKINDALQKLRNFPTVMGPLTLTKTQHSPLTFPEVIAKYQNGKEIYVMSLTPKYIPDPFKK